MTQSILQLIALTQKLAACEIHPSAQQIMRTGDKCQDIWLPRDMFGDIPPKTHPDRATPPSSIGKSRSISCLSELERGPVAPRGGGWDYPIHFQV